MVGYFKKYANPKTSVTLDQSFMGALRLAKVWMCTPQEVLDSPCDHVIAALEYERFHDEYEQVFIEINKDRA